MNLITWISLLLITTIVIILKISKKRKNYNLLYERQISIKGMKTLTYLGKETPLTCLRDHGKISGESFKDKDSLQLPHNENCYCKNEVYYARSREVFESDKIVNETFETDLGIMDYDEARYYQYLLISKRSEDDEEKQSCITLLESMKVSLKFIKMVESHFKYLI